MTNTIKLAWEHVGNEYESQMSFNIPGYTFDHTHSKLITHRPAEYCIGKGVVFKDEWTCCFYFELEKDGHTCLALLTNEDFNISNTVTAEEMMQAVGKLTPEDIAAALQKEGYRWVVE